MPNRYREIVEALRERWALERSQRTAAPTDDDVNVQPIPSMPTLHSLAEALSADSLAFVVEPKRATPSREVNPALDVAKLAAECERAGASAISIVTESELSGGSLDDLARARTACELPLIGRDFVVDVEQVIRLRSAGADAVMFPAWPFCDVDEGDLPAGQRLEDVVAAGLALGMDVVLSVRTSDELALALDSDVDMINIDNRDADGHIDVELTLDLLNEVPVGVRVISESVAEADDVARLHRAGVDALLLDEGHHESGLTSALEVFADLALD